MRVFHSKERIMTNKISPCSSIQVDQPFYDFDSNYSEMKHLKLSQQKLIKLLKHPPCKTNSQEMDVTYMRKAVKEVLAYHTEHLVTLYKTNLHRKWHRIYRDPIYSHKREYGTRGNYLFDLDGDGSYDAASPAEKKAGIKPDAFPMNTTYSNDSDGDYAPDRIDLFPNDPNRFISPDDVKDVQFKGERPILQTRMLLERGSDCRETVFQKALQRWQKKGPIFLKKNIDESIGWDIEFTDDPSETNIIGAATIVGYHMRAHSEKWSIFDPINTVVHEVSHHLGLPDRYIEWLGDRVNWLGERYKVPNETVSSYLQKSFLVRIKDMMADNQIIYPADLKITMAETATWPEKLSSAEHEANDIDSLKQYASILKLNPMHPKAKAGYDRKKEKLEKEYDKISKQIQMLIAHNQLPEVPPYTDDDGWRLYKGAKRLGVLAHLLKKDISFILASAPKIYEPIWQKYIEKNDIRSIDSIMKDFEKISYIFRQISSDNNNSEFTSLYYKVRDISDKAVAKWYQHWLKKYDEDSAHKDLSWTDILELDQKIILFNRLIRRYKYKFSDHNKVLESITLLRGKILEYAKKVDVLHSYYTDGCTYLDDITFLMDASHTGGNQEASIVLEQRCSRFNKRLAPSWMHISSQKNIDFSSIADLNEELMLRIDFQSRRSLRRDGVISARLLLSNSLDGKDSGMSIGGEMGILMSKQGRLGTGIFLSVVNDQIRFLPSTNIYLNDFLSISPGVGIGTDYDLEHIIPNVHIGMDLNIWQNFQIGGRLMFQYKYPGHDTSPGSEIFTGVVF